MLTLEEAHAGFITALEAELEAARADDMTFDYVPTQQLAEGRSHVYLGTLEEEVQLLEGSIVRIVDQSGRTAQAEVVAVDDFELVLASEMVLRLGATYTIKYNLKWLLEALLDWIRGIDVSVPRPIAEGERE